MYTKIIREIDGLDHVDRVEEDKKICTSSLHMSSWAVWAETMMCRAAGVTNPSSTALSMNDRREL